jgi:hypothetical protein
MAHLQVLEERYQEDDALRQKVDSMLLSLSQELDSVDSVVGGKLKCLDADDDGWVSWSLTQSDHGKVSHESSSSAQQEQSPPRSRHPTPIGPGGGTTAPVTQPTNLRQVTLDELAHASSFLRKKLSKGKAKLLVLSMMDKDGRIATADLLDAVGMCEKQVMHFKDPIETNPL